MLTKANGTAVHLQPDLKHQSMSAAELVVTNIKQQLIDRRLRAGDRLPPETELCEVRRRPQLAARGNSHPARTGPA